MLSLKFSILANIIKGKRLFVSVLSLLAISGARGNKMQAVQFEPGPADLMKVQPVAKPILGNKEVLVKVFFTAVNRADLLQRNGKYPPPPGASDILGLEATGQIENLDPNCSSRWKQGDRVMTLLPGGGYAEYVAAHEDLLIPVPDAMTLREAAAIPEVWLTAYQLLHLVAKVQRDEKVLIHAGGSGVGTAAVQLVRSAGAVPIVTAGSEEKINFAKSLGAAEGYNYKTAKFGDEIQKLTNGKGVDIILDCIGSSFAEENVKAISMDGRWVVYGLMGGRDASKEFLGKILAKRISLLGSTLRSRSLEYKARLIHQFNDHELPNFASGKFKTIIDKEFPLTQIIEAHKYMESNANIGKILIRVRSDNEETKPPHQEL